VFYSRACAKGSEVSKLLWLERRGYGRWPRITGYGRGLRRWGYGVSRGADHWLPWATDVGYGDGAVLSGVARRLQPSPTDRRRRATLPGYDTTSTGSGFVARTGPHFGDRAPGHVE